MRNEADDPDYFEEIGVSLPQCSSKQVFLITFDPPRLKDSVIAEYDTLDIIKLKFPREGFKKPVPENVLIRATIAERIE